MGEQELRLAFLAALPDRMVGIEMAHESWALAPQQALPEALEELYRLTHNLAGAAALYGYEQVSAPCRVLECYLRNIMRGVGSSECDGECVGHMVATIRCVVRQVDGGKPG